MKRLFLFILIPFFIACNNDEPDYTATNYYVSIATVENPNIETTFFMTIDDSSRLYVSETNFLNYRPTDKQRIIANYQILPNTADSTNYDYNVKLRDVYEVLTKEIFEISAETEDSIGNDYISIESIWVGSHYLNVEFVYPGTDKMHFINLVSDSTKTYDDNKTHLEFRHNSNGDYPGNNQWGLASFNLKSLETSISDTLELVIHTKEFKTASSDSIYTFNYIYSTQSITNTAENVKKQNIQIRNKKAVIQ